MDEMTRNARRFCELTGLTFLAVSGDAWLDTEEQLDLAPGMWLNVLRHLEKRVDNS